MRGNQAAFRGALLGLAVGDAMGNAVDRKSLEEIRRDYGPNGLLGYDLVNGYAEVTSYTQVAAFAANGLLLGLTRGQTTSLVRYIGVALREWSRSQQYCEPERNYCWLSTVPGLKRRRCMDTRMLDALSRETLGTPEEPVYRSNQPSGLTEAVPAALLSGILEMEPDAADRMGAEIVALTHGDPSAFLSGAALVHALCLLMRQPDISAEELLRDTVDAIQLQFGREYGQTTGIWELLQLAVTLADSEETGQMEAMELLRCRTAPEVLAGALYACITCHGDFDAAMITAVNHSGRSAAVGAVTGAVLGIKMGEGALPEFYLESLEPAKLLRELADDLAQGNPADRVSTLFDDDWDRKYLHGGV
ncbi:MAG: ADP-ribosylglycohydrolase family protein [Oscillospiraceae bacterium]|nr:ADP-ribosylglycohydrolase family protein [Oscillospiraceae bacterium]